MTDAPGQQAIAALSQLLAKRASLMPALLEGPGFASAVRMRMSFLGVTDTAAYAARVASEERELRSLASEISVPETWLFRYPLSYEFLLEHLRNRRSVAGGSLVCASLGCATGVEAWCIAACALAAGWDPQSLVVHAIDRNPDAIETAEDGRVGRGSVRSEPPSWASPWIKSDGPQVELSSAVRSCVRVRSGDILIDGDLFDQPIGVLFCRNVLIYLDPAARMLLRDRMAKWLAPEGILFLGHADGMDRGILFERVGPAAAFALQHRQSVTEAAAKTTDAAIRIDSVVPRSGATPTRAPGRVVPLSSGRADLDRAALRARVASLIQCGEFAQAASCVESAIVQLPSDIELLETIAGIYSAQNSLARAHRAYVRVVYLDPNHGPALLALAELSASLGRMDESDRFRARLKRLTD
ncbi:MAG: hypothetical protein EXS01_03850 [Phycisphaerales bacterium]|nr:hypothetical protein [Phycisphaerales bacterium]